MEIHMEQAMAVNFKRIIKLANELIASNFKGALLACDEGRYLFSPSIEESEVIVTLSKLRNKLIGLSKLTDEKILERAHEITDIKRHQLYIDFSQKVNV